jgi:hypothetical protein
LRALIITHACKVSYKTGERGVVRSSLVVCTPAPLLYFLWLVEHVHVGRLTLWTVNIMSGSNRRISRSFFSDGEDEDRSGTAAGDGLDRTVSCGNLFCPQQPAVSPRRHWSRPQSSALQRVKYGAPSHSTGNIYQLHGAELPRSRFVRIRNDEQRPVKKRRRSGLRRAYTRSLDDGLDKPEIMGQLRMNHSGLSSQEDLPHEKVSEDKSSVNDFPVNTESDLHLESTGDEVR